MDGNSLGRLPGQVRDRLNGLIDEWGERMVRGWPDWIDAPRRTGDVVAEVIGARSGTVLVTDSVTINLYKLVNAVLDTDSSLRRLAILLPPGPCSPSTMRSRSRGATTPLSCRPAQRARGPVRC